MHPAGTPQHSQHDSPLASSAVHDQARTPGARTDARLRLPAGDREASAAPRPDPAAFLRTQSFATPQSAPAGSGVKVVSRMPEWRVPTHPRNPKAEAQKVVAVRQRTLPLCLRTVRNKRPSVFKTQPHSSTSLRGAGTATSSTLTTAQKAEAISRAEVRNHECTGVMSARHAALIGAELERGLDHAFEHMLSSKDLMLCGNVGSAASSRLCRGNRQAAPDTRASNVLTIRSAHDA